jgi:hypothetical protein
MQPTRFVHGCLAGVVLISAFAFPGCTHNYYYGVNPCAPAATTVVPSVVSAKTVCEVPGQFPGTTVVTSPMANGSALVLNPRPPRVVVSEPGRNSGSGPRFPWRTPDPESSLATTKTDGALGDDSTVK